MDSAPPANDRSPIISRKKRPKNRRARLCTAASADALASNTREKKAAQTTAKTAATKVLRVARLCQPPTSFKSKPDQAKHPQPKNGKATGVSDD